MVRIMYSYIEGTITEIKTNYITLENNKIGYLIYTANPYIFKENECCKLYIYQHVKEDEITLYGFKEEKEKDLFLKLINVKGLGCRLALTILTCNSIDEIITAIDNEDISYLKKIPKIGDKVARQIILDLKGKLVNNSNETKDNKELIETLKTLGYKTQEINKILPNISKNNSIEQQIKEALKLLLK